MTSYINNYQISKEDIPLEIPVSNTGIVRHLQILDAEGTSEFINFFGDELYNYLQESNIQIRQSRIGDTAQNNYFIFFQERALSLYVTEKNKEEDKNNKKYEISISFTYFENFKKGDFNPEDNRSSNSTMSFFTLLSEIVKKINYNQSYISFVGENEQKNNVWTKALERLKQRNPEIDFRTKDDTPSFTLTMDDFL